MKPQNANEQLAHLRAIFAGKICPYCNKKTQLVDSATIYRTSYGKIYICFPCNAYVGCHTNTTVSKGSLANRSLRKLRNHAHRFFDPLWKAKMQRDNCSQNEARTAAYSWLSKELGIPREFTHIGMFDEEQCRRTIELCKKFYE